jgi:hypothetical protein
MNGLIYDNDTESWVRGGDGANIEVPEQATYLKGYDPSDPALKEIRKGQMERIAEYLGLATKHPLIRAYSRNKQYVGVRTVATAATARAVAVNLWNPHATSRIFLFEAWTSPTSATVTNLGGTRTTARGTASTSLAMAINNSIENDTAAPSGYVLDTAWTVAPTVSAANMIFFTLPATIGSGIIIPFPDPMSIPAGTGWAFITTQGAAYPASDVTFVVGD